MKQVTGFSLLNVLIALLIFTFGMLALAGAYFKVNSVQGGNEYATNAGILAESLRSTLSASPNLLTRMNGFKSTVTPTDNLLKDWVKHLKELMPDGKAEATVDPSTCSTPPCTVRLTMTWTKNGQVHELPPFFLQILGY
jgi:Tfp pilus assembly protein PilV